MVILSSDGFLKLLKFTEINPHKHKEKQIGLKYKASERIKFKTVLYTDY